MPSLQQRKEDIPALIDFFIDKYCRMYGIHAMEIGEEVVEVLQASDWWGNVRQLENKIQQALFRVHALNSRDLQIYHFFPVHYATSRSKKSITYRKGKDDWECKFILLYLEKHSWNISATAKTLNLSRSHLNNLIRTHNLERKQ